MKMLKWWRWFRKTFSWRRRRGWKNLLHLSGASLPVSEEHGCKGSEFASWVKQACLVSLNFAWHALNYINYTPICTLVKRLLLYTGHWSQLWKHICINSGLQLLIKTFMVAIFAIWSWTWLGHNFDQGLASDQNCIFSRQFTFHQTEAKNHIFLHHIVFSPSVSKFFLHYIVRKSVFELFLHCILTPDLYFPLHQTHLLLAVTNFWWCIARAWCAPKLFLISNQLLLNFQAPNICLLPLTTTNFTLLNSMFCVYLHILCVYLSYVCFQCVFPHHYLSLSLTPI